MDLRQIHYFLVLAQELHFWNTAEQLHITQSALSRQIQALEAELGVLLFERNKRNVKLTAAGAFLRTEWTHLLTATDGIHRRARQIAAGDVGDLRIGHPGSVLYSMLPELLAEVARTYPVWRLELSESTEASQEQALFDYRLDVGLRREPTTNARLASRLLFAESFALVVPAAHALTAANFSDLTAVRHEKFILPPLRSPTAYGESLRDIFRAYNFQPDIKVESDFGATILSLVAHGLGISLLPISYAAARPAGVRFIEIPHQTPLFVIWRTDDNNPALHNLLQLLTTIAARRQAAGNAFLP